MVNIPLSDEKLRPKVVKHTVLCSYLVNLGARICTCSKNVNLLWCKFTADLSQTHMCSSRRVCAQIKCAPHSSVSLPQNEGPQPSGRVTQSCIECDSSRLPWRGEAAEGRVWGLEPPAWVFIPVVPVSRCVARPCWQCSVLVFLSHRKVTVIVPAVQGYCKEKLCL